MIRPFRAETERYGHYSVAGEFIYDHPFQWGSKRTGPDLARVGGRYSDLVAQDTPAQSARRGS
jgi:cytochrome c oxidase cbb3-type subunit 2